MPEKDFHYVFTDELICYRIPVVRKERKYVHLQFAHPCTGGETRIPKKAWTQTEKGAMERYLLSLKGRAKEVEKQMKHLHGLLQKILALQFERVEVKE